MMMRTPLTTLAFLAFALLSTAAAADEVSALRAALDASARADWPTALAAANDAGAVGRDIIEWQRLREGDGLLGDYEGFLARRPDWPGLSLLKKKGEIAVARSTDPARVLAYFGTDLPTSAAGALAEVQALLAQGRTDEAQARARWAWVNLSFDAGQEAALLTLAPQDAAAHQARLDRLLWENKISESKRMLPRVSADWVALAQARLALKARAEGVTALVAAVPAALKNNAGLAYARFDWRVAKDLNPDAAALILERSTSAEALGNPEAWADRRASFARTLLRSGEPKTAYKIAARHYLTSGSDYADLEFLAGFIALRHLGDAKTALKHFAHLEAAVSTPISASRALYWQGRAHEAMGARDAATAEYRGAAKYQTAYYGQLAAERLGLSLDAALLDTNRPADWRGASFARSSVLEAALLLLRAGDLAQGKRFILHLAEGLDASELAQLADLTLTINQPHIAVLIGKQAAERNIILPRAYFPLTEMVPDGLAVSRALALSIARRESEFDPSARSHAGARGLMQVMPATAEHMAPKLGLEFNAGKLTSDPAYNAAMGSGYLRQLVDEFGPSIALVASGYNAGPGRPRRWITEFGDPRRPDVDVIDWVETIPFSETRTYVMRVSESVVIYRAKLRGSAGPVRLTAELKG